MEIINSHRTHNLSEISSEEPNDKKNDKSKYTSSSDKEYYVKNDSQIEWANLIKRNNSIKHVNHSILNEEDINLSNNYHLEQQKNKDINFNVKINHPNEIQEQNDDNNKDSKNSLEKNNFRVLNNGFIVKNLNKFKKGTRESMDITSFYPSKSEKNIINLQMSNEHSSSINNDKNCFFPKYKKVKKKKPIKVLHIEKPNRSFFTKVYKFKRTKNKKPKEKKKMNNSSSVENFKKILRSKYLTNSSRITRINTLPNIIFHSKEKEGHKDKNSINYNNKIKGNSENKLFSSSLDSSKNFSVSNNISLFFSRRNSNLIQKDIKNKTLSSINAKRNENKSNGFKLNNFDIKQDNNKSTRKFKARPMSSIMNTKIKPRSSKKVEEKENIIYENANFVNQFKELKNAFDICENNKINNDDKFVNKINDYNFIDFYNKFRDIKNRKIIKERQFNSIKLNKTSYNHFFLNGIKSLYNFDIKNINEEENNKFCRNCGYQKHFGNEKICPVCIALKEQYHRREEKSSNKYYYFPFKEKYEGSYSMQTSFRKTKYNFNDIKIGKILNNNNNFYLKYININKDNKNSFNKSFYLNSIFASPINKIRKKIMKNKSKNKSKKKNRSLIINKYDVIKKYFA